MVAVSSPQAQAGLQHQGKAMLVEVGQLCLLAAAVVGQEALVVLVLELLSVLAALPETEQQAVFLVQALPMLVVVVVLLLVEVAVLLELVVAELGLEEQLQQPMEQPTRAAAAAQEKIQTGILQAAQAVPALLSSS